MKFLKLWEEFVGELKDIRLSDDGDVLHVEFSGLDTCEFFIQGEDEFVKEITNIPKGTKIGILRTDDDLRVRVIK